MWLKADWLKFHKAESLKAPFAPGFPSAERVFKFSDLPAGLWGALGRSRGNLGSPVRPCKSTHTLVIKAETLKAICFAWKVRMVSLGLFQVCSLATHILVYMHYPRNMQDTVVLGGVSVYACVCCGAPLI